MGTGDSGALASAFGYTGHLYLPELQLYYYKARMYSPKVGRFLQPDPIGYVGGMNLYSYAANDPANRTDPSGLCDEIVMTPVTTRYSTSADDGPKTYSTYTDFIFECVFNAH